jgi:hypothetical protein
LARLSVVIPTLNEAVTLPHLLLALHAQSRRAEEVIVADAGSVDDTRAIARAHGARLVAGGPPGVGRNRGAERASGGQLLFLDADVLPPTHFVRNALAEFDHFDYAVATCLMSPWGEDLADRILVEITNLYLQVVQVFSPHAPGCCILVRREVHDEIGGFNEHLKLGEDHDYVQRAVRIGPFGILSSVRMPVSMRRLEREGVTRLAVKYLWCEIHALAGKPITSIPFEYQFGEFSVIAAAGREHPLGHDAWPEPPPGLESPVDQLSSAGLAELEGLVQEVSQDPEPPVRLRLDASDLATLQRYLQQRRALLRIARWKARRWTRMHAPRSGGFRRLDRAWVRSRWSEVRRPR